MGNEPDVEFLNHIQPQPGREFLLSQNLFAVVYHYILRAFLDDEISERDIGSYACRLLIEAGDRNIPYVRAFWNLALKYCNQEQKAQLQKTRSQLLARELSERHGLTDEVINQAFPLPDSAD
ncbi:MAG: hypothetical protein LR015_05245 [Verrucomicrobia bacterium]|nr:hypothetical protein [Verrucomicrobiota bacterium]